MSYIENYTKAFLLALYQIPTLPSLVRTFFEGVSVWSTWSYSTSLKPKRNRGVNNAGFLLFWAVRKKLDEFF